MATDYVLPPRFRVLYRSSFGANNTDPSYSATDWTVLDQPEPGFGGVELLIIHPQSLPDIGTAEFRYLYGKFADGTYARGPDLKKYDVRLQLASPWDETPAWVTVFWGHVDYQEDNWIIGSTVPAGVTTYRCVSGFARTMKWPMNRHGVELPNGTTDNDVMGNPGYNYQLTADGPLIGNKSPLTYNRGGVQVNAHTWQGAFALAEAAQRVWTEWEALMHALSATRPDGEPLFALRAGDASNYSYTSPIQVEDNANAFDFSSRIVRRSRGMGNVWEWFEDQLDGSLRVGLGCYPLFLNDITYTDPKTSATVTLSGSTTAGGVYVGPTATGQVNLQNDNRIIDSETKWADAESNVYDYIETVGEYQQIAVTLSYQDQNPPAITNIYDPLQQVSLAPRWTASEVGTFTTVGQGARARPYWDHVFQAHGIPRAWRFTVGNGFGVNDHRVDYHCNDAGAIVVGTLLSAQLLSAPLVEVMPDMPLYVGYKYTGSAPERTDGSVEYGMPSRRPIQVYGRPSANDKWALPDGQLPEDVVDQYKYRAYMGAFSPDVSVHSDAILCYSRTFQEFGQRVFSDVALDATLDDAHSINALYNVTQLAFTVGLRLPIRVRCCDAPGVPAHGSFPGMADWTKARRKKSVYVRGVHLWMIDYACIYDLDQPSVTIGEGFTPMRAALGGTAAMPGIARDDRDRLMRYHKIISNWYLSPRQRIQFGMRACGLIDDVENDQGSWPKLGQYISAALAGGTNVPVNTTVTSIRYDHQAGTTVWNTDWFDVEVLI